MKEDEQLEKSRARVIEAISQNMNLYGVSPSVGRMYCLLFFSDKPLTLDEMGKELGMSKASMSLGVRTLLDLNMVEKAWIKGIRKDLYVIKDEPYQRFFDYFTTKWQSAVNMNTKAIKKSIAECQDIINNREATEELREQAQIDIQKLQNWLQYYGWLDRLIDSFETKEILDFIPLSEKNNEEK